MMQISVRTVTGNNYKLKCGLAITVAEVKAKIYHKEGIPKVQQRLFYKDQKLEDKRTLRSYDIGEAGRLCVYIRRQAMIGTFTSTHASNDPLVAFLMLSDEEQRATDTPLVDLQRKANHEDAYSHLKSYMIERNTNIVPPMYQSILCNFLDFMWDRHATKDQVDMRLSFEDEEVLLLLLDAVISSTVLWERLQEEFRSISESENGCMIALRTTRGPTKACINFHRDGFHATGTVQVALNEPSEYQGGKLCFYAQGRLDVLERPAGTVVKHYPRVLHAVTALTRGSCKSLFVLDKSKPFRMEGVILVCTEDVQAFVHHCCSRYTPTKRARMEI